MILTRHLFDVEVETKFNLSDATKQDPLWFSDIGGGTTVARFSKKGFSVSICCDGETFCRDITNGRDLVSIDDFEAAGITNDKGLYTRTGLNFTMEPYFVLYCEGETIDGYHWGSLSEVKNVALQYLNDQIDNEKETLNF